MHFLWERAHTHRWKAWRRHGVSVIEVSRIKWSFVANRTRGRKFRVPSSLPILFFIPHTRHNEITNLPWRESVASETVELDSRLRKPIYSRAASFPRNGYVTKPDCVFGGKTDRLSRVGHSRLIKITCFWSRIRPWKRIFSRSGRRTF